MNWPKNVVPAVWNGLSRLFGLSSGLVINRIGPSASGSPASIRPPGRPSSRMASRSAGEACANGGRLGKTRPKNSGEVALAIGSAQAAPCPSETAVTAPAAAALPKNPRLLTGVASDFMSSYSQDRQGPINAGEG